MLEDATTKQLRDRDWLENAIWEAGIYPAKEIPSCWWNRDGGLGICQYPTQFAPYLIALSKLGIKRYAEIGVWVGGTFRFTVEYLKRFGLEEAFAVDIDIKDRFRQNISEITGVQVAFIEAPSTDPEVKKALQGFDPDLILVDGDHTEEGARADCKLAMNIAPYVAVHDIVGEGFPGVIKVWGELKGSKQEWTDQHPDQPLSQNGMGLVKV